MEDVALAILDKRRTSAGGFLLPLAGEADARSAAGEGGTSVIVRRFRSPFALSVAAQRRSRAAVQLILPAKAEIRFLISFSFLEAHPAVFRSRPASGSLLFAHQSRASARPLAARVTFLCSCKEKSPKESTFKQSIPRRTCTRALRTDENSTQNSVVPGGPVFRFACNERPACGANDVSACDGRVVYGAFIPSQNPRAGPPRDALLSRCFLVTSLHQQRSDPLGLRPSGSFALVSK